MGILLFILSTLISWILIPVGLLFGFFKQFHRNSLKKAWKDINNKFMSMAISHDKYGNVVCAELFNATLIKKSKNLFGDHRKTISHVIGLNLRSGNLTATGRALNYILNLFDKDHSIESIEE